MINPSEEHGYIKEFLMKNMQKPKISVLFAITVITTIIALSLSGCMSMAVGMAQSQFRNHGVFDSTVPKDQLCELRFININVKTFNGVPVVWGNSAAWGNRANNQGFVKIPAGINTIVFDWEQELTQLPPVDFEAIKNRPYHPFETRTLTSKDISFSNVRMLPGHNYAIGGALGIDGWVWIWLADQTYMPIGYYGDDVADPPVVNNTPTKFEGTWRNEFGEIFIFSGNTWLQISPPMSATNFGPREIRARGTFEDDGEYITMYNTDVLVEGMRWLNVKPMRQAFIWKYDFSNNNNVFLEIPYAMPRLLYTKQ